MAIVSTQGKLSTRIIHLMSIWQDGLANTLSPIVSTTNVGLCGRKHPHDI